jgi:hypothetical protein
MKIPDDGSYLVEVSYIGYETIKQTVSINRNTTQDFFLQESVEHL